MPEKTTGSFITTEAAKAAPAIAISGATKILGCSLETWVAILTITYILIQIFCTVRREFRQAKRFKEEANVHRVQESEKPHH